MSKTVQEQTRNQRYSRRYRNYKRKGSERSVVGAKWRISPHLEEQRERWRRGRGRGEFRLGGKGEGESNQGTDNRKRLDGREI